VRAAWRRRSSSLELEEDEYGYGGSGEEKVAASMEAEVALGAAEAGGDTEERFHSKSGEGES